MSYAKGLDVSKWQGTGLDWKAIRKDHAFAFLRVSSSGIEDPTYMLNFQRAREAGLLLGGYHYLYPENVRPMRYQAELFARLYNPTSELPGMLDVEEAGLNEGMVYQFLTIFEELTGRIPGIYTSQYKWHSLVGRNKTWASRYPLWVAHYTSADQPLIPDAWKTWTFWQYTSSGSVPNYSGRIDKNRYNGDEQSLYDAYVKKPLTLEERVSMLEERVTVLEQMHEV